MEKGTISKIFDYYFSKTQFKDEVIRALREFFNKPDLKAGGKLELQSENDEKMLNEWFVFDFNLSNGKIPLEDFYEKNPYNLNIVRLQTYKDLQDNHFGFYKVKEIRLGEGLILENLQTGKVYQVREFAATFALKEEQVFSARVGKVGDHYELVGADPSFGPVKLDAKLENLFKREKRKLNPKILRDDFLGGRKKNGDTAEEYPSLDKAEEDFKGVLAKYDLDKFVSSAIIKEWIYNYSDDDPIDFVNMLCSLLYSDMKDYGRVLTEISNSFNIFYNLCPQKELGGKSPFEKSKEQEEKGIPPDISISLSKFSSSAWDKKYSKALQYMKQAEFKKALKKFNEVFTYLLENKISYPEIYRLYANKGVCHFALAEAVIGEFMLKISAELNPFYDFAKQQLEKYKEDVLAQTREIKKPTVPIQEQDIAHDIGYQYYQFLKPLKINFSHIPKDYSVIDIKRKRD